LREEPRFEGMFGSKSDETIGISRKCNNYEFNNLRSSPNRMINSRRMRWAGRVELEAEKRNAYGVLVERKERDH
jgi:hypothetical protein